MYSYKDNIQAIVVTWSWVICLVYTLKDRGWQAWWLRAPMSAMLKLPYSYLIVKKFDKFDKWLAICQIFSFLSNESLPTINLSKFYVCSIHQHFPCQTSALYRYMEHFCSGKLRATQAKNLRLSNTTIVIRKITRTDCELQ